MGSWHNLSSTNQVVQCLRTCFRCAYLLHYAWIYLEMQFFFLCWLFLPKCKRLWELIVLPLMFVAGGVMGYMKSGSQKSLAAGGISALVLYFVHTQLPVRPVFASSIGLGTQSFFWSFGPFLCLAVLWTWIFHLTSFWFCILGISAALLSVMGSRFKKSGKIFPAGVVSLVSLVMVGGYFHGILRSSHAW